MLGKRRFEMGQSDQASEEQKTTLWGVLQSHPRGSLPLFDRLELAAIIDDGGDDRGWDDDRGDRDGWNAHACFGVGRRFRYGNGTGKRHKLFSCQELRDDAYEVTYK